MNEMKLNQMKNGKATDPDGISAEALGTDLETTADMILPLFKKTWEEEIPTNWKDGHIIKLPKKETSAASAVRTTEASHSCHHQGKCSTGSCWRG
jgi:hypothetical protein